MAGLRPAVAIEDELHQSIGYAAEIKMRPDGDEVLS